MSYSICIACKKMVGCYQKYCDGCVRNHGVTQDELFHKNNSLSAEEYDKEFAQDKLKAGTL